MPDQLASPDRAAHREKTWVALSSLLAAVLLTGTKLVVGVWTNSLGILSEAAHSALDLAAAGITLWAVRVSALPPDQKHNYGHGKFENLSALAETLLLLATCVWIIIEAVRRLSGAEPSEVQPNVWAFGVVVLSIVVDYSRSRALMRAAKKYQSQALEADALHFSTDIWSSGVVLVGLLAVLIAETYGIPWLAHADALAALGVALIVVWVSLKLGRRAVDELLDVAPPGLSEQVIAAAAEVRGVVDVRQVRLRRSGPSYFVDITVGINRVAAFEQTHEIASATEAAVRGVLPDADVVVHVEPAEIDESLDATIQLLAQRHGLNAHSVRVYKRGHYLAANLHVEVDPTLTLEAAHDQVSAFEGELQATAPRLRQIVTHIEPQGTAEAVPVSPAGRAEVERALAEFWRESGIAANPHNLHVQRVGGELAVSLHCQLDAATAITDAHQFSGKLEAFLRRRVPGLARVIIHVEPARK